MVDEHKHEHEHGQADAAHRPDLRHEELDAAGKSLADALRISFAILKVIMIILVVAFLASGFKTVGPEEKALVLRFGRIHGVGSEAVLEPGAHWVPPYPIGELVRFPAKRNVNLAINTFWYKEDRQDILGAGPKPRNLMTDKLDPLVEGYCLTSGQRVAAGETGPGPLRRWDDEGSDYNIIHTRWQINYQIADVEQFFRNLYIRDVKPGEVYFDVMTAYVTPLLKSVVENAVVSTLAHYSIDEAILSADTIRRNVSQLVQQKLDELDSGIRVTQVQLVDAKWPKQVDEAFQAFFTASQERQQAISEARTYAENTLSKTAGRVAAALGRALLDPAATAEQREALWTQVAGEAQNTIAQAQAYRTKVVDAARANAVRLQSLLPEYRKRPEIVAQEMYLSTMQEVLKNADEKFILDRSRLVREQEFRILVNRDVSLKPKQNSSKAATP
jgi:membrane protease subunit HflK